MSDKFEEMKGKAKGKAEEMKGKAKGATAEGKGKAKGKASEGGMVDKAADFINKKTEGKYSEHIEKATEKIKDMSGKDDKR